jgi:hypothetical protein
VDSVLSHGISTMFCCTLQGFGMLRCKNMKRRMERVMATFPFEVPFDQVQASIDAYVDTDLPSFVLSTPDGVLNDSGTDR